MVLCLCLNVVMSSFDKYDMEYTYVFYVLRKKAINKIDLKFLYVLYKS